MDPDERYNMRYLMRGDGTVTTVRVSKLEMHDQDRPSPFRRFGTQAMHGQLLADNGLVSSSLPPPPPKPPEPPPPPPMQYGERVIV